MTGPVWCLAPVGGGEGKRGELGHDISLVGSCKGHAVPPGLAGAPFLARYYQVNSSCGGYNMCSQETSLHKSKQLSQVDTLANPCQQWQTLTRFAMYFKQTRFWLIYLGFTEAS
jgi:hypothetical protein